MSRRAKFIGLTLLGLPLLGLVCGLIYLRSAHFQRYVQARIIRQLEQLSGGRVEMRGYRFNLSALEVQLDGLVIRGLETGAARPLFASETVFIRLKITSLLRREIDWRLLRVTRPHIQVTVDSSGRSNVPEPKTKRTEGKGPLDKVWDMAIKRLEVIEGEMRWNDRRVPLEFTAENLSGDLTYEPARDVYAGRFSFDTGVPSRAQPVPAKVQADLLLSRTALEITRMTAATARSTLEASGRLSNFVQPKITLSYKGRLDVNEVALASRHPELRGGLAHVVGALHYDSKDRSYGSSGNLKLERVGLKLRQIQLAGISGSSPFQASPGILQFPQFRLSVLGGRLAGSARITGMPRVPEVVFRGQASGFSVAALASTFSPSGVPLDRLRWAGSVDGKINGRFQVPPERGRDVHNLWLEASLTVHPPSVTPPSVPSRSPAARSESSGSPGMIPVSGHGDFVYTDAADRLEIRNAVLSTPASNITADGVMATGERQRGELKLAASTTDLAEWTPLVSAMRPGKAPVPLELKGRAEFRGSLRGSPSAPSLEGRLEAVDFAYDGARWDRFSGELAYSRGLLRLTGAELRREGSFARLNLSADLDRGEFTDSSPFSLQAQMEGARLNDLQKLAGADYPITGVVDGSVRLSGTRLNPQGSGVVSITAGTLLGEPFDSLRANLNFSQRELRAQEIVMKKGASQVTGEADYRPADKSYRFQLAGDRIPLAEINHLRFERLSLSGLASFHASGSGSTDRPAVDADIRVANLVVNGEPVGNLTARLETRNTELTARIESQLQQGSVRGTLSADLTGDFPAKGRLEFTGVDLDPFLQEGIRGRVTTHSTATGFLDIAGPLKKIESLAISAEIRDFKIAIEQADLRNAGPLRVSYRNGAVQIDEAHFTGAQTDLKVSGTMRLAGPPSSRAMNLRADGTLNMALVRTINADLVGSGLVAVQASATGSLQRPLLVGRAEFRDAAIAVQDFPTGLSKMAGAVAFDARGMRIEKLTAEAGGGEVNISDTMTYADPGGAADLRLRAEAQGVRLRYPEGTSSVLNAELSLTGSTRRALLAGDVIVTRVRFDRRFDLASALGFARVPTARSPGQLMSNLALDVRVVSSPDLRFEFSQARNVQMEASLRLRGTAARPALLGRINLLQGEIYFAGTEYVVNRGDISFVNPIAIEPRVNLSLQTRAQQYEITIDFNGTLDAMSVSYRSDPPMPSGDIQALLITGRTREGPSAAQAAQSFPSIGANTILSQALNATVGSRIERIFGVSRLKIDPQVGGPETNPGARVTLEQQVTPDIRFTYITNLASSQQQVIQVEWTINPRWSVIAVRDRNGLFGIDLKWRKRFR